MTPNLPILELTDYAKRLIQNGHKVVQIGTHKVNLETADNKALNLLAKNGLEKSAFVKLAAQQPSSKSTGKPVEKN